MQKKNKILDLATIFNVDGGTVRTYLGRAEFSKIKRERLRRNVFLYAMDEKDIELLGKRLRRNFT